jgi:hypothetical protein
MTVTFAAASGSALPSRTAPRAFTTTGDVAYVCARFPDSDLPEEVVYRDGAFRPPYSASSTRVGNSFTIVRSGGWPSGLALRVEELVTVAPSGRPLGAIYEVDLTAMASQTMTTAGSYTIDGKTWWAKGTVGTNHVCELVSGLGLRMFAPATIGGSSPDRMNFRTVTTGILQRILFFPLAQLTDYNPSAPAYVVWTTSTVANTESDRCYSMGVMTAALSSAAITNTERASCVQVCPAYLSPFQAWVGVAGNTTPTSTVPAGAVQVGVYPFAKNKQCVFAQPYSGTWVTPDAATPGWTGSACYTEATQGTNMGFFYTLHKAFSDGQTLNVYLTRLAILQPKVIA